METKLKLSSAVLPPWTGRRCVQKLMPLDAYRPRRTVNGELVDLLGNGFGKLKTTISGKDRHAPFQDNLRKGQKLSVDCICHLWRWCPGNERRLDLERLPVSQSTAAMDNRGIIHRNFHVHGSTVTFDGPHQGLWLHYRPILHMRVTDFSLERDERNLKTSWVLSLSEV